MADGNCWMSDSLKLELYDTTSSTNINPTPIAVEVVNNNTGEIATTGTNITNGKWTPDGTGGTSNAATALNGNTAYNSSNGEWHYSWYAATANSGTESMTDQDATLSICPRGWRLPTNYTNTNYPSGGANKSWGYLVNAYGISPENHTSDMEYKTLGAQPFSLPRVGFFHSGALWGDSGQWWSATAYSTATNAYDLSFYTTYVNPQDSSNGKLYGFNVRCVAI